MSESRPESVPGIAEVASEGAEKSVQAEIDAVGDRADTGDPVPPDRAQ